MNILKTFSIAALVIAMVSCSQEEMVKPDNVQPLPELSATHVSLRGWQQVFRQFNLEYCGDFEPK